MLGNLRKHWSAMWPWGAVAAAALLLVIWVDVVTTDPGLPHDSALNAILDSHLLVSGARVLLGAGMLYLLLSIAVRVKRGQWARNAGPIQTDATVPTQAIVADREDTRQQLSRSQARLAELSEMLDRSLQREAVLRGTIEAVRGLGEVPGDEEESRS